MTISRHKNGGNGCLDGRRSLSSLGPSMLPNLSCPHSIISAPRSKEFFRVIFFCRRPSRPTHRLATATAWLVEGFHCAAQFHFILILFMWLFDT